ncbi:MAG: hypothetical protein KBT87_06705 [Gammaproteobacteria bacterium]|jgi:hypothetical protein|nr:hypothetical protein [Gammaproteobacteria bacterium]MBQ0774342.1 hypothetical protein [Gammaproteobacteria bacterium]
MRLTLATIAMLSVISLHAQAAADTSNSSWEKVRHAKQRGDVTTWVRPVPGNPLKAFKGQIEVPHNMLTVFAVFGDIERFPQWVYQCDYARLLPELGNDIAYIHIAGIWPVDDRDVVARTTLSQDPNTLAISVHTVAVKSLYPEQKKTVRIPNLESSFIMEPLHDGWTRLTFETFADPGGAIPAWLANLVATRAPRDTLEDMHKLMPEAQYQINDIAELPPQFPQLTSMVFPNAKIQTNASKDENNNTQK